MRHSMIDLRKLAELGYAHGKDFLPSKDKDYTDPFEREAYRDGYYVGRMQGHKTLPSAADMLALVNA